MVAVWAGTDVGVGEPLVGVGVARVHVDVGVTVVELRPT